jgi:pyruvate carboxylase
MQARVNCVDPQKTSLQRWTHHLLVSPGGQGVRIDSCICAGYRFPSRYDSAAALLITYGNSWDKTVMLMRRCLREYKISGVKTTINFHREVMKHPDFVSGEYDTNFVRLKKDELMAYTDQEPDGPAARLVGRITPRATTLTFRWAIIAPRGQASGAFPVCEGPDTADSSFESGSPAP